MTLVTLAWTNVGRVYLSTWSKEKVKFVGIWTELYSTEIGSEALFKVVIDGVEYHVSRGTFKDVNGITTYNASAAGYLFNI